jgi:hypothetical protein
LRRNSFPPDNHTEYGPDYESSSVFFCAKIVHIFAQGEQRADKITTFAAEKQHNNTQTFIVEQAKGGCLEHTPFAQSLTQTYAKQK